MNRLGPALLLTFALLPPAAQAQEIVASSAPATTPAPATPATAAPVLRSTGPASVADTGETVEQPKPQGLTEPAEGIFVTLTRRARPQRALPANTETVEADTFRMYDAQTAGEAVSRLTSVRINSQGRTGSLQTATVRGSSTEQTLVLLDGRPVGGVALAASQDLSEIPVEQIDHIEVVRGAMSALYGPNAVGGVINVISKRATHPGLPLTRLTYEAGAYGRQAQRLSFGSRLGLLDFFFFGNRQFENGFRNNADARTHNVGGNVGVALGKAGKVLFDFGNYHANAGQPGQLFPDLPVSAWDKTNERQAQTPHARQITDTQYLRASYVLPLPGNILATLRGFGSEREVEFADPDFLTNSDRVEKSRGGEAQVDLPYGFMVGGSFIRDREDSRDRATPANNFIAAAENWGVFIQETFAWGPLTLIPSGRYDHNSNFGETKNPRVQLMVDATDWLRFSGAAGRSFRAPTIDDLYYPFTDFGFGFSYEGNPNLRPEKAWTYDAGFELHEASASFRANYFRANVRDLIQTTADAASTKVNIGQARRQGVELTAAQTLSERFQHSLNYTYLKNVGIPDGFSDFVDLRLSPRHSVNYFTRIAGKGLHLDQTARYVSSRWEGNDRSGTKLGSTFLWDLRLGYDLRQLELFIGANNVTDKRYEERGGFPLAGRTIYGGFNLRLWG
jgi:outer membrane cobalamin receptor